MSKQNLLSKNSDSLIILLFIGASILAGISFQKDNFPKIETKTENVLLNHKGYYLEIKKIDVLAPIILNVNGTKKDIYFKALESGVAQFEGTSLPGEIGNSFIFGHSSYYDNAPGNYKKIFARLNELNYGDQIDIYKDENHLVFEVIEKKIVEPTDLSVLKQTKDTRLTLMTCWPLGSTKERLIVVAKKQ